VASIPVPGGCSLRPVKNRGRFVEGVDQKYSGSFDLHPQQNSPPYFFTWQSRSAPLACSLKGGEELEPENGEI